MDAKALAKSKRAHSQHHSKKSHPSQKSKAPSDRSNEAGSAKNPPGKQVKDNNLQLHGKSKLPSNWDRYDEEVSVSSDGLSNEAAAAVSDVILPKSKGADYRHLIAEAQSQMQSYTFMDVFPSLDDVLPREFSSGGSAMVAEKGESILSWIGDASFIVDEKATANPVAPFLSLNLHTLAEQLEKIDLAERLFIEEDLLPPELRSEGKTACNQQSSPIQFQTDYQETKGSVIDSIHDSVTEFDEKCNNVNTLHDSTTASSSSFKSIHHDPTFNPPPIVSNQINNPDPIQLEISSRIKAPNYTEQLNTKLAVETETKKTSTFEATAAEAELDLLLGSFSEPIDLGNSTAASSASDFDAVFKAMPHLPSSGRDSANKAPVAAEFDDALDALLQETSILVSHKEKSFPSQIPSPSPHSETKSTAKDDFDSWFDTI